MNGNQNFKRVLTATEPNTEILSYITKYIQYSCAKKYKTLVQEIKNLIEKYMLIDQKTYYN